MKLSDSMNLLRVKGHNDHKVSFVELFFDLVFVFTIIQLSHTMAHHFSLLGAVEVIMMGIAVWWIWIFTTWVTNWLDPDKAPVRAMLFVLMFFGLLLSTSIPEAFGDRGWLFVTGYVGLQMVRSAFMMYALKGRDEVNFRNFRRITVWLAAAGVLWIAGLFFHHEGRLLVWGLALLVELISPAAGFYVPGLGKSSETEWDISGHHMSERCALFIIICLGETILVMGGNFTDLSLTVANGGAFATTFLTTLSLWWIYFRFGHERAAPLIGESDNPGGLARWGYTYAHIPIVIGVLLIAVAANFSLNAALEPVSQATASVILGGPMVFLLGNIWFKTLIYGRPPLSHLIGVAGLAVLFPFATVVVNGVLAGVVCCILLLVAGAEWRSLARPA